MGTHPIFESDLDCLTDVRMWPRSLGRPPARSHAFCRRIWSLMREPLKPLVGASMAVYVARELISQHLHDQRKVDFEIELIRHTNNEEKKFNHLSDLLKIHTLKRNLYHLDGISSQTRLPHDTYFWVGSACLAAGACVGVGRFLQYQKRLLCYRYQCAGQNCSGQMLSRPTNQSANSVKCRGYSRMSQDQIEARDLVFNQLILNRHYRNYKKELKVTAAISAAVFAVGAWINLDHITKSTTLASSMLRKQWGVDELDHESTLRLLSILIERNLFLFEEHHLRIVAEYVAEKTGDHTYWDVPSTYMGYSPLVIMQFLFDELELNILTSWPALSAHLEEAFVHYSTVDDEGETFWERTWIGKSYLEWSKADYECRDYLLACRNHERQERQSETPFAAKTLKFEIDRINR